MPFTIHNLKLPFVRITTRTVTQLPVAGQPIPKRPVTTTHTWAWHVGPWQYNTRTGQHTVKLSRTVRYVSRNRTQKAAAAKKRAERRTTERAGWDTYFAGKAGGVPAPPPPRAKKRKAATKKRAASPARSRTATTQRVAGTPAMMRMPAKPAMPKAAPTPTPPPQPAPTSKKPSAGAGGPRVQTGAQHAASGHERVTVQAGRITVNSGENPPEGPKSTKRSRSNDPAHRVIMNNAPGVTVGQQVGVSHGDYTIFMDGSGPAGQCGQTTADGSPCERLGTCPPGTHHPRRRSTGKKGKR